MLLLNLLKEHLRSHLRLHSLQNAAFSLILHWNRRNSFKFRHLLRLLSKHRLCCWLPLNRLLDLKTFFCYLWGVKLAKNFFLQIRVHPAWIQLQLILNIRNPQPRNLLVKVHYLSVINKLVLYVKNFNNCLDMLPHCLN